MFKKFQETLFFLHGNLAILIVIRQHKITLIPQVMSVLLDCVGVECLRGLVELDVRFNAIKAVEELVKISSLLHLRILALTGKLLLQSYCFESFHYD